jgi:hypothetical protein
MVRQQELYVESWVASPDSRRRNRPTTLPVGMPSAKPTRSPQTSRAIPGWEFACLSSTEEWATLDPAGYGCSWSDSLGFDGSWGVLDFSLLRR